MSTVVSGTGSVVSGTSGGPSHVTATATSTATVTVNSSSASSTPTTSTLSESQLELKEFWPNMTKEIKKLNANDLRLQELPLARIKKVMKLDEDVKMISAEAPVLFAKAAEIFINELTLRAWIHTEDNKRRTLQRNDIAMAITKYDQFDFLIDIVPRDEIKPNKKEEKHSIIGPEQVQYYLQLAQQHNAALQLQQATAGGGIQVVQGLGGGLPTYQLVQGPGGTQVLQQQSIGHHGQTILLQQQQQPQVSFQSAASAASVPPPGLQIVQQVIGPNGEIQQVPVQLTAAQLQMLRMQLQQQSNSSGSAVVSQQQPQHQPIILQTGGSSSSGQ